MSLFDRLVDEALSYNQELAQVLIDTLKGKYGLQVAVSEPTRESGNVATWKLKIQTRPPSSSLPAQRLNIDVCAIPSLPAWSPAR